MHERWLYEIVEFMRYKFIFCKKNYKILNSNIKNKKYISGGKNNMLKNTVLLDVNERVNFWITEGDKFNHNLISIAGYSNYNEEPYSEYKGVELCGIVTDGDFEDFLIKKNIDFNYEENEDVISLEEDGIKYVANILKVPTEAFVLGECDDDYYDYIIDLSSLTVKSLCEASLLLSKSEIMKLWTQDGHRIDYPVEDTTSEYIVTSTGEQIEIYGVYWDGDFEGLLDERNIKADFCEEKGIIHLEENGKKYIVDMYNIDNRFSEDSEDEWLVQLSGIKAL